MRVCVMGLLLVGCAASGVDQDSGVPPASFAPEPPPGATTETRYTLACDTLKLPDDVGGYVQDIKPIDAWPSGTTMGPVLEYALDPDSMPLGMVAYSRLSERVIDWAASHDLPIEQGVERWVSEFRFNEQGHPLVECEALAACADEFPCQGWDGDLPNWPDLVGWMQDEVELIVWE